MGSKKKQRQGPRSGKRTDEKPAKRSDGKSGKKSAKQREQARVVERDAPSVIDAVPAIATVDLGVRDLQARLEVVQAQFGGVVAALSESTARLQAAVALIADLPTRDAATDSGRELRQRLEQMLVAQQRTNELLDLALGVAVAPDVARRPV